MTVAMIVSASALLFGLAGFVLGIAQLSCEHADAPWPPRIFTGAATGICGWLFVDGWDALAHGDYVDNIAVAYAVVLCGSWSYRRWFGVVSTPPQRRRDRHDPLALDGR